MAKKKKEGIIETKKVALPEEKPSFFPKLMIVSSLIIVILAIISLIDVYPIPKLVTDIVILLAGLWLLKVSFEKGFVKRRKEIMKKYI